MLESNNKTLAQVGLEFDQKVRTTIIVAESFASIKSTVKIPAPPPEPKILSPTNKSASVAKKNIDLKAKTKKSDIPYLSPTLTNINGECEPMITDQSPEASTTNTVTTSATINILNNKTTNSNNIINGNGDGDIDNNCSSMKCTPNSSIVLAHELTDEEAPVAKGVIALPFDTSTSYKNGGKIESSVGLMNWDSHTTSNTSLSDKYSLCKY